MSDQAEWRPVVGYEGLYEVSNHGNIKSLHGRRTSIKSKHGNILAETLNKAGYLTVGLCKKGKSTTTRVHCIVSDAFMGEKKEGVYIDHIDGCKTNNKLWNLEFVTPEDNSHRWRKLVSEKFYGKHIGISYHKIKEMWTASKRILGKNVYLGAYSTEKDAERAVYLADEEYLMYKISLPRYARGLNPIQWRSACNEMV